MNYLWIYNTQTNHLWMNKWIYILDLYKNCHIGIYFEVLIIIFWSIKMHEYQLVNTGTF